MAVDKNILSPMHTGVQAAAHSCQLPMHVDLGIAPLLVVLRLPRDLTMPAVPNKDITVLCTSSEARLLPTAAR